MRRDRKRSSGLVDMSTQACEPASLDAYEPVSVYLLAMPKQRLQVRLSEKALAELERRAGGKDKRQAFLETWLTRPAEKLYEASPVTGRKLDGESGRAIESGEVPPHSFHSGTRPVSGCAECAKAAKDQKRK